MTITKDPNWPEMCDCGRLYKDRLDIVSGETMCSACFTGLSVNELKLLWGYPIPKEIEEIWKK